MSVKIITSGPWESVYNSLDNSEAYKTKLYSALNLYRTTGDNSFNPRPPWVLKKAAGTLGTAGGRYGQRTYLHMSLAGSPYRFVFCGGKVYRWDGDVTYTDVTPAVTISATARIYCASFDDNLVVHDGTNKPWYVPSSGCAATPLVATTIEYNSAANAWSAFGPMAVYDARLFFVANSLNGVTLRDTLLWSEVGSIATGYQQTNFANFWELFQTDPNPIQGIAATEISLVVFRALSILNITGKTDQTFQTNATRESIEGIGSSSPASILVHNGVVWFLDIQGRQHRYQPGSTPEALWPQMADTIAAVQRVSFPNVASTIGVATYSARLNLVLSVSYPGFPGADTATANLIHAFDADSGLYYGPWDVDGGKLVHAVDVCLDSNGQSSVCVLGESTTGPSSIATSGQMWRIRRLEEMTASTSWADPSAMPVTQIVTHHLGRNEEGDWAFDQLVVRAVQSNVSTSARTLSLSYVTPRGSSTPPSVVMTFPPSQPVIAGYRSDLNSEMRAVWGLGPNAQGRWLMAQVSGPTTNGNAPPFTPTAVELRGTISKATPQAP